MASSSSSPPIRIDCETTIPPSEITATSVVPPPTSTTIEPIGSGTGKPAPVAAPSGPDPPRHRLLDQVGAAGAGREAGLLDRAFLDPGNPGGDTDDDARTGEAVGAGRLDEVAQHLLGNLEVGDDTVLERPDRGYRARRASQHPLRLAPDRGDVAGARVDRHHRRLREHNSPAADVDKGVSRAQVDSHVAAAESSQVAECAHVRISREESSQTHLICL